MPAVVSIQKRSFDRSISLFMQIFRVVYWSNHRSVSLTAEIIYAPKNLPIERRLLILFFLLTFSHWNRTRMASARTITHNIHLKERKKNNKTKSKEEETGGGKNCANCVSLLILHSDDCAIDCEWVRAGQRERWMSQSIRVMMMMPACSMLKPWENFFDDVDAQRPLYYISIFFIHIVIRSAWFLFFFFFVPFLLFLRLLFIFFCFYCCCCCNAAIVDSFLFRAWETIRKL